MENCLIATVFKYCNNTLRTDFDNRDKGQFSKNRVDLNRTINYYLALPHASRIQWLARCGQSLFEVAFEFLQSSGFLR